MSHSVTPSVGSHVSAVRVRLAPRAALPAALEGGPDWGATRCLVAATALPCLVGVPLGVLLAWWTASGQLAAVPWVGLLQAHGQTQLFGWLGLAILGVTFHAMAHLFGAAEPPGRVAWSVLLLQLAGVALRLAAPLVPGAAGAAGGALLLGSALSFAGAFGLTLEAHVRTMSRRGPEGRAPAVLPRYLLAGLSCWLIALLANLDGAIDALRQGPVAAGAIDAARDAVVVAGASGGFALVALGMSLRVVAGWLDLPRPDLRRAGQAWWLLAAAVLLRVLAAAGMAGWLAAPAALLWAAGVGWYLPALGGLWSRATVTPGGGAHGEADPALARFVRTAYAWLAVSAALALGEALSVAAQGAGLDLPQALSGAALADAGRHALLLGFLGTLTAGLTGRLPTAFLDVGDAGIAATRALYRATWALLLPAAALRVAGPLLGPARSGAIELSGVLAVAALCCLLAALLRIIRIASAPRTWRLRPAG